jgi:hypothetical protein
MKITSTSTVLIVLLLGALSMETALGQGSRSAILRAQHAASSPKSISRSHQPVGTPSKASSYAPHHTNRRVFGAPIQPQILHKPPAKKPGHG